MKNQETYQQLLTLQENCIDGINQLIDKHKTDPDLSHTIGRDPYCQYCDQYNDLNNKLKTIRSNIQLYEKEHSIHIAKASKIEPTKKKRLKIDFSVFDIVFKNGDQFLIYSDTLEHAASAVKYSSNDISHSTVVKKDYYGSIYLEEKAGSVTNLAILTSDLKRKTVVLGEKEQIKNRVKGLCYNEVPFEFFNYSIDKLDKLKRFCGETITITRAKKKSEFKRGKINLQGSRGSFSMESGQVLIKLGNGYFYVLSPEEFKEQFSEDEALSWNVKND